MAVIFCSNCGAGNTNGGKFCFACGQKLQQGAVPTPATLTGLLPPHTLLKQRYRILQSVGKGGMGAVYMAQDNNLGDRLVAVKEMSQAMLSLQEAQDASENFKKEAYLLAGLHHPNLPSIHEHFEEQGRWYLVMSFIEGQTLENYMKGKPGGKVSLEEGLQIALALCDVLEYLHVHNPPIIFRDLKPSNIIRTSQGRIYLIDFGIARHFKPGQAKDTANYGSAGFSPPEQYGRAQTSPRSDIYSLGATLYYLLSGYSPSLSPFRLPLLQSQVPTLPTGLTTLITQMLSLDENMRPASIQEVKSGLEQFTTAQSSTLQKNLAPTIPASSSLPPHVLASTPPLQANVPQQQTQINSPSSSQAAPPQQQIQASKQPTLRFQTSFTFYGMLLTIIGIFMTIFAIDYYVLGLVFTLIGITFLSIAAIRQSNATSKVFFTICGILLTVIAVLILLFHIGGGLLFLIAALLGIISLRVAGSWR